MKVRLQFQSLLPERCRYSCISNYPRVSTSARTQHCVAVFAIFFPILLFAGCDSAVIEGKVFDARGETLPGVSVLTVGTPYEALTNGRGEYHVRFVPSQEFHVKFFKTGYTTGDLRIQKVLEARSIQANAISLISLPESPGVYLSDDRFTSYVRTTIDGTPANLVRKSDKSTVVGTYRTPVETLARRPFIVVYRGFTIPRFGMKLNRLEETDVKPPEGVPGKEGKAWVRAGEVPVDVREVDVGQGQLLSMVVETDLDFGGYAVHWGALDGNSTSEEPRIFCFKIVEQLTPPEGAAKPAAEETTPGASTKKNSVPPPAPATEEGPTAPAQDDEG